MPAPDAAVAAPAQRHRSGPGRPSGRAVRRPDLDPRRLTSAESMRWANLLLSHRPADGAAVAAGRPTHVGVLLGQHARLPVRLRRGRLRRRHRRRPEPHPGGRAPAARHRPHRRRPHPHRARAPRRPGRSRPGRSTGDRVAPLRRGSGRAAQGRRRRPRSGGGAGRGLGRRPSGGRVGPDRSVGAHLHLGHLGGAQGGDLHPAAAAGHRQPHDRDAGHRARRRRLRGHAPVPLQRGHGRLGTRRSWPVPRSGLARRFSVSGWLPDVRRYGATWFNYTGKPLSYLVASPAQPDDADNTLRVAFGNEGAPQVLDGSPSASAWR